MADEDSEPFLGEGASFSTFLEFLVILLLLFGLFFGALIVSSTSGDDHGPSPTEEHHNF